MSGPVKVSRKEGVVLLIVRVKALFSDSRRSLRTLQLQRLRFTGLVAHKSLQYLPQQGLTSMFNKRSPHQLKTVLIRINSSSPRWLMKQDSLARHRTLAQMKWHRTTSQLKDIVWGLVRYDLDRRQAITTRTTTTSLQDKLCRPRDLQLLLTW